MYIDNKKIPYNVKVVMKKLKYLGYEAYLVGGAARDIIMGIEPKDYDIATNARPETMMNIFNAAPTGINYGTVTITEGGEIFEVTTYRKDVDYDGRRPKAVNYSDTLEEDLKRRDFTINSLAIDINGEVTDFHGGINDINNKILKAVGNPHERFKEDKLRVLRGVRIANKYSLKIDEATYEAIKNTNIGNLSTERVNSEFSQMLKSHNPGDAMRLLKELGLLEQVIPEFLDIYDLKQNNVFHDKDVFEHTMVALDSSPNILEIRLAILLHDIGKGKTKFTDENGVDKFYNHEVVGEKLSRDILIRLRYPNSTIEKSAVLVRSHMMPVNLTKSYVRKLVNKLGEELAGFFIEVKQSDTLALNQNNPKVVEELEKINKFRELYIEVLEHQEPTKIKDLAVNGYDIMKLGYNGKEIGDILSELLQIVLENPDKNIREVLLKEVMEKEDNINWG